MRAIGDGFIANYGAGNYTAAASALANGVNPEPAGGAASLWASHPRFGHPSKRTRASFLYQSILWEEILGKPALIQCGNKSPVPGWGQGRAAPAGTFRVTMGPEQLAQSSRQEIKELEFRWEFRGTKGTGASLFSSEFPLRGKGVSEGRNLRRGC